MPILLSQLKNLHIDPERVCSVLSVLHLLVWMGVTAGLLSHVPPETAAVSVAPVVSKRIVLNLEHIVLSESSVDLASQERIEEVIEEPEPEPLPEPEPEPAEEIKPEPIEQQEPQEAMAGSVSSGSSAAAMAEDAVIDAAENSQQAQLVYAELRAWIEKRKSYPTIARRLRSQGTVTVVVVLENGRISAYEVINNTGHRSLQQGLEKTMKRVQREFKSSHTELVSPVQVAVEYALK